MREEPPVCGTPCMWKPMRVEPHACQLLDAEYPGVTLPLLATGHMAPDEDAELHLVLLFFLYLLCHRLHWPLVHLLAEHDGHVHGIQQIIKLSWP